MTTIALDSTGLVACDSRETAGQTIVDDNCAKHSVVNGVHFWIAGRSGDARLIVEAVTRGERGEYSDGVSVAALVHDSGIFYTAGISKDEGFYLQIERAGNPVAIGSGSHHALTAMDLGLSAKDAVKYAAKRDSQTGGKIRTWQF